MAKPKLALIPAAQGSKFYSVLPSSGVGDFDFTRSGSATRINSQGLIETVGNGVSRLNYPLIDGKVVGCPSHLLEPSRTNLQVNSEEFDNTLWSEVRASITPNDATSPSGLLNADKLVGVSGTTSYVYDGISVASGSVYTISVFAKYIDITKFKIVNFQQNGEVTFNIQDGLVVRKSGTYTEPKIENYGNGWYRCSAKFTATATGNVNYGFSLNNAINKSIHIWGAQFELGAYPTTYIPTTTATVTRSAETANGSGDAATFNDSEGVLMVEISALADDSNIEGISISDGSSSNRVVFFKWNSSNSIRARVTSSGVNTLNQTITISDVTTLNKIAIKYKLNDFAIWINGIKLFTDTSGSTPIGLNELNFNSDGLEELLSTQTQNKYNTTIQH